MSRAFVNEDMAEPEPPPERQVSPHRNLVTRRGLALIEEKIASLAIALAEKPDSAAKAVLERDRRYWLERRATAELVTSPAEAKTAGFGSRIILARAGGRQTLSIVGEDEADPQAGKVSYVSPLALALKGAAAGDEIEFTARETETIVVIAVDNREPA
jgi:transcription elongation GreA/GreB family factor